PYWYAMVLVLLLGVRLWDRVRRLAGRRRRGPLAEQALVVRPPGESRSRL
ncbi:MAG: hypothetical protein HYS36_09155, partial [Candidatus Rokubacteria bacterium]|nr:hypothetical protein [Candidatus Rokubacteria bacterium]